MARDIGLMKKAVKLLPPVSIKEAVDLNLVLEELWRVTQEEMNFLTEAANMEEFSRKNKILRIFFRRILSTAYAEIPDFCCSFSSNLIFSFSFNSSMFFT